MLLLACSPCFLLPLRTVLIGVFAVLQGLYRTPLQLLAPTPLCVPCITRFAAVHSAHDHPPTHQPTNPPLAHPAGSVPHTSPAAAPTPTGVVPPAPTASRHTPPAPPSVVRAAAATGLRPAPAHPGAAAGAGVLCGFAADRAGDTAVLCFEQRDSALPVDMYLPASV